MMLSTCMKRVALVYLAMLALSNTALGGPPKTLIEYDQLVGTFDYLHPERFELLKTNPSAPPAWTRLFTPQEYAVAAENHSVAYEAAVRMGLFSSEVQRQLGIIRIDASGSGSLTVFTRDGYGTWKFFLTAGLFDKNIVQLVSLSQDNAQLAKTTQIHLTNGHSEHLKKGVDMWLYVESRVDNAYAGRSSDVLKTQAKITSDDLVDPKGLYVRRIKELSRQQQKQARKRTRPSQNSAAMACEAMFVKK
jgi:hypothetical protein